MPDGCRRDLSCQISQEEIGSSQEEVNFLQKKLQIYKTETITDVFLFASLILKYLGMPIIDKKNAIKVTPLANFLIG